MSAPVYQGSRAQEIAAAISTVPRDPRACGPARFVGVVDPLGYLYCAPCAREYGAVGHPVQSDAAPHNLEPCDSCARTLAAVGPDGREHCGAWFEHLASGRPNEYRGPVDCGCQWGDLCPLGANYIGDAD